MKKKVLYSFVIGLLIVIVITIIIVIMDLVELECREKYSDGELDIYVTYNLKGIYNSICEKYRCSGNVTIENYSFNINEEEVSKRTLLKIDGFSFKKDALNIIIYPIQPKFYTIQITLPKEFFHSERMANSYIVIFDHVKQRESFFFFNE